MSGERKSYAHPRRAALSSRCDLCGGELRLKQIESANRAVDLDTEIIVCVKCRREQSRTVSHNHNARHMPTPKAA